MVNPKPFDPAAKPAAPASAPAKPASKVSHDVQVLHQPPDRGDGHLHPDDLIRLVAMSGLPTAQFPTSSRPEIKVTSVYTGAGCPDRRAVCFPPIEQQMSGVDNTNYVYSLNANNGQSILTVNFGIETDSSTDQLLTQMRQGRPCPSCPAMCATMA
ncbi:efflux RND transporter permease subunit [Candidatus Skiveiella danica]|uniref:efflux RND transporter permease subunit n=1 Tax=Candidatus Skiveiella danica TaxID=3386177 RepID=UPI0039B887D0